MAALPETDMSDLAIASRAALRPISRNAEAAGIPEDALEPYGKYKAKIDPALLPANGSRPEKSSWSAACPRHRQGKANPPW